MIIDFEEWVNTRHCYQFFMYQIEKVMAFKLLANRAIYIRSDFGLVAVVFHFRLFSVNHIYYIT